MASGLEHRIEDLEKEVMEKQEQLNELRRQRVPEEIRDYVLQGPGGQDVRLSDLFDGKRDLIVIHNMGASCPYCTLWADGFNGLLPHFENRAAFVVVSPDTPEAQAAFAGRRGWRFRMFSNGNSGFTEGMGYLRQEAGRNQYWPGFSTFRKRDDGRITRVAHANFGPGDPYCGIWHMFALLEGGVAGWEPRFTYD